MRPAVEQLLERVALVDGGDAVALLARATGSPRSPPKVTSSGRAGPAAAAGGASLIEVQAAADETRNIDAATGRAERARFAVAARGRRVAEVADAVEAALEPLHESDARMAAVAERLGGLGAGRAQRPGRGRRTERAIAGDAAVAATGPSTERADARGGVAQAARRGQRRSRGDPSTDERDRLDARRAGARRGDRAAPGAAHPRGARPGANGRADRSRPPPRENEARARQRRAGSAGAGRRGRRGGRDGAAYAATGLARAAEQAALRCRARPPAPSATGLASLRREARRVQDELRELTDTVHRDEVARTQHGCGSSSSRPARSRSWASTRALVEEFGPHRGAPATGRGRPRRAAASRPYVREVQEKRLRTAERGLAALGRVNPLALEEFSALEERHTFLTGQLEDLKRSKRDLLDIVKEVDERVEQVFTEAFHDTADQFERVFERLFPGGEGRLVLTDPGDMLTTGIEVEARPPGKKVKRLSLLSGGERSLTAVALLVAIFKARPSPFYVMDEVEAALDDTNLGRLIAVFEELRDSSQLIVITHQKRTMEVADALYGVTMRGDDSPPWCRNGSPRRGRGALGLSGRTARRRDRPAGQSRRRRAGADRGQAGVGAGPGAEPGSEPTALGDGPYWLSPWLSWT